MRGWGGGGAGAGRERGGGGASAGCHCVCAALGRSRTRLPTHLPRLSPLPGAPLLITSYNADEAEADEEELGAMGLRQPLTPDP